MVVLATYKYRGIFYIRSNIRPRNNVLIGQHVSITVVATGYVAVRLWWNRKDAVRLNGYFVSLLRFHFRLPISNFLLDTSVKKPAHILQCPSPFFNERKIVTGTQCFIIFLYFLFASALQSSLTPPAPEKIPLKDATTPQETVVEWLFVRTNQVSTKKLVLSVLAERVKTQRAKDSVHLGVSRHRWAN